MYAAAVAAISRATCFMQGTKRIADLFASFYEEQQALRKAKRGRGARAPDPGPAQVLCHDVLVVVGTVADVATATCLSQTCKALSTDLANHLAAVGHRLAEAIVHDVQDPQMAFLLGRRAVVQWNANGHPQWARGCSLPIFFDTRLHGLPAVAIQQFWQRWECFQLRRAPIRELVAHVFAHEFGTHIRRVRMGMLRSLHVMLVPALCDLPQVVAVLEASDIEDIMTVTSDRSAETQGWSHIFKLVATYLKTHHVDEADALTIIGSELARRIATARPSDRTQPGDRLAHDLTEGMQCVVAPRGTKAYEWLRTQIVPAIGEAFRERMLGIIIKSLGKPASSTNSTTSAIVHLLTTVSYIPWWHTMHQHDVVLGRDRPQINPMEITVAGPIRTPSPPPVHEVDWQEYGRDGIPASVTRIPISSDSHLIESISSDDD